MAFRACCLTLSRSRMYVLISASPSAAVLTGRNVRSNEFGREARCGQQI